MICEKKRFAGALIYLFINAVGLSFYTHLCVQSHSYSIDHHGFNPPLFFTLMLSLVIFSALVFAWRGLAALENKIFEKDLVFFLNRDLTSFIPLSLSLLSPLLLSYYLTAEDLQVRLYILGVLMGLGVLFIKIVQISCFDRTRESAEKIIQSFCKLSMKRKIVILFVVSMMIYSLISMVLIHHGRKFTGDEPNYLLTTHSLYEDQDINIADDYEEKEYTFFLSDIKFGIYGRFGKKGTSYIYPINLPGISVLLLPSYWLSHFFDAEARTFVLSVGLCFWAALLGIQLFLFFQETWGKERTALFFWFLYSFTVPILFYSIHLYPEIVVAFFSLYVFRKIRSQKPLSVFQLVLCGFLLSSFFWMGLKYNLIYWPLLMVSVYFLMKEHKTGWKTTYFLFFPIVSQVLFAYFVYSLYGTVNPISIYEGVMNPAKMKAFRDLVLSIPVWLRIDSFLDYFLDQRDGLLLYAPFYFFMFVGAVEMFRRSKKDLIAVLFISLPFLFNYAFLTHRQGFCPQGRILTPLSWLMIWLVGYFFIHNRKKTYSYLFFFACGASLVISVILWIHPSFLYQSTTHIHTFRAGALFLFLSNLNIYVPSFLPSFIKVNNLSYAPNYVWIGLIVVFVLMYVYKKGRFWKTKIRTAPLAVSLVCVFLFYWLALFPRTVLIHPQRVNYLTGEKLTFYSLSRAANMKQYGEFRLSDDARSYRFLFTSWRKIKNLEIGFRSLEGEHKVKFRYFDRKFFNGRSFVEEQIKVITDLPYYAYKNTHLYMIDMEINRIPNDFSRTPLILTINPQYE
ncbi:MAG: hypothetical protein GF421_01305 [Candidatus Aminicenantes bacterium]|nr:hypothetical protein [Candidatus Aminicenantes bacterium]